MAMGSSFRADGGTIDRTAVGGLSRPLSPSPVLDSAGTAPRASVCPSPNPAASESAVSQVVLTAPSLTCRLCAREISAALHDVPGVRTVAVDVRTTTVVVRGAVAADLAQAAVVASGHAVTDVRDGWRDLDSVGHDRAPHPTRTGSRGAQGEHP